MTVTMVRGDVNPDHIDDVEAAVKELFAAIDEAQPAGVHYASCRGADSATFLVLVQVDDGIDNPLPGIPAFVEFQQRLAAWLVGPPTPEQLTVLGSYALFSWRASQAAFDARTADSALRKRPARLS